MRYGDYVEAAPAHPGAGQYFTPRALIDWPAAPGLFCSWLSS